MEVFLWSIFIIIMLRWAILRWLAMGQRLQGYGATGKNILPLPFRRSLRKRICPFFNKPDIGSISILVEKSLILRLRCLWMERRFAKQSGRYFFAAQKGSNMSAQAVGGAVGHNPISLIVPCHRVVGSNGSLTGYAGGIDKKIQLLTLEKIDISAFFVPRTGTAL